MYGIFTYICVIFGVNVGKYSSTMEHLGHKNIQHPNHQPREKPPGVGRGGPGLDLRFLGVAHGAGRRGRGTRTRGAVAVPWATGRCHGMGRYGGHLGEIGVFNMLWLDDVAGFCLFFFVPSSWCIEFWAGDWVHRQVQHGREVEAKVQATGCCRCGFTSVLGNQF